MNDRLRGSYWLSPPRPSGARCFLGRGSPGFTRGYSRTSLWDQGRVSQFYYCQCGTSKGNRGCFAPLGMLVHSGLIGVDDRLAGSSRGTRSLRFLNETPNPAVLRV